MRFFLLFLALASTSQAFAQSDFARVYNIFQARCASCHNGTDLQGNLDLVGTGANVAQKMNDVYGNIVNITPVNAAAQAKGYKLVTRGRADKSFMFHKVNGNLDPYYSLPAVEGSPMPGYPSDGMELVEREMIRQWILAGANPSGYAIDTVAMAQYFGGMGLNAFDAAPPAPAASEGFQIKMGPFFLKAGGEIEYYQKWGLNLPSNVEVPRIDIKMSGSSHHFIIYHFNSQSAANAIPDGLRTVANHSNIGLTAAVQEATNLVLPEGTAFKWESNKILDLNSHYINYSQNLAYRAESYINVYTQPTGTAAQEMFTELEANLSIFIPNGGDLVEETDVIAVPQLGDIWMWGLMGHTHKYGTGFNMHRMNGSVEGEMLYDGACPQGIPGCASPYFDYQHIPLRLFPNLNKVDMAQGIQHRAFWVNDGPTSLYFGPTSNDEMMVSIFMFTMDTVGLNLTTTNVGDVHQNITEIKIWPNPGSNFLQFELPNDWQQADLQILDAAGQIQFATQVNNSLPRTEVPNLSAGLYLVLCTNPQTGEKAMAKWMVAR